jgi:hypothetical protein
MPPKKKVKGRKAKPKPPTGCGTINRGSGTKNVIFSNGPNYLSECSKLL